MDPEKTCYVANFSEKVNDELLEELFTQVGPLNKVTMIEKGGNRFAMVEFKDEESVMFAVETLEGILLFNQALVVKPRNNTKQEELYKQTRSERERRQKGPVKGEHPQSAPNSQRRPPSGDDDRYKTPRRDDLKRDSRGQPVHTPHARSGGHREQWTPRQPERSSSYRQQEKQVYVPPLMASSEPRWDPRVPPHVRFISDHVRQRAHNTPPPPRADDYQTPHRRYDQQQQQQRPDMRSAWSADSRSHRGGSSRGRRY